MRLSDPVRLLVIPGLHDSGPAHWQSWLEAHFRHALRVRQDDWADADLDRWAARIDAVLQRQPPARWIAVAHSFGCLALARHLADRATDGSRPAIRGALFVAPADPAKFGVASALSRSRLAIPSTVLGSETDPWMHVDAARSWALSSGARFINLGDVGHINAESGFGPLPQAKSLVVEMSKRLAGELRIDRVSAAELSFAI
jgi:predicted alpha/beta hydrolase family esterase